MIAERCLLQIAVDPVSGDVVYDNFVDDHMRSELETRSILSLHRCCNARALHRLMQLQPTEILLPSRELDCLSDRTREVIRCAVVSEHGKRSMLLASGNSRR